MWRIEKAGRTLVYDWKYQYLYIQKVEGFFKAISNYNIAECFNTLLVCKNSSIEESDNRRVYVFDKNTKPLKGLKVFILENKKETLIVEITRIDYNVNTDSKQFNNNLTKGLQ